MEWVALFIVMLSSHATAYYFGHHYGVKDTEARWSDAVSRTENARRYEQ